MQRTEKLHSGSQGHAAQKTAQGSAEDQLRRHRSSPRFRRGSS